MAWNLKQRSGPGVSRNTSILAAVVLLSVVHEELQIILVHEELQTIWRRYVLQIFTDKRTNTFLNGKSYDTLKTFPSPKNGG